MGMTLRAVATVVAGVAPFASLQTSPAHAANDPFRACRKVAPGYQDCLSAYRWSVPAHGEQIARLAVEHVAKRGERTEPDGPRPTVLEYR